MVLYQFFCPLFLFCLLLLPLYCFVVEESKCYNLFRIASERVQVCFCIFDALR